MSNKAIEQALAHLIPTHADALPPQIVSLASSLYVQSRHHGSALKPEEEIARPFACAEIACKRLSRTLRLPPLIGRPPCPPRMYGRIYKYIEGALAKASVIRKPSATRNAARRTARAASHAVPAQTDAAALAQTPQSTQQATPRTPQQSIPATPSSRTAQTYTAPPPQIRQQYTAFEAPSWMMAMIRNICKVQPGEVAEMRKDILSKKTSPTAYLAPHMYTGVSSMLSYLRNERIARKKGEDWEEEFLDPVAEWVDTFYHHQQRLRLGQVQPQDIKNETVLVGMDDGVVQARLMTLLVATYLVFWSRILSSDEAPVAVETYVELSRCSLAIIGLYSAEHVDEVDIWLSIIMQRMWTQGKEWFEEIPLPNEVEADNKKTREKQGTRRKAVREENKIQDIHDGDDIKGGLLPGLATMMQDKLDFLSEERRQRYATWKKGIMQRIEELEKEVTIN